MTANRLAMLLDIYRSGTVTKKGTWIRDVRYLLRRKLIVETSDEFFEYSTTPLARAKIVAVLALLS